MADLGLHLVKIPLRAEKMAAIALHLKIAIRDLDDGYLAHCILRKLWQDHAPAPFALRGRGRSIDVWGYTKSDAAALISHARGFGDPALLGAIDDIEAIASKPMPRFAEGQRVGFHLRACPIVRLSKPRGGHRAGAEIDAFLAQCLKVGRDVAVSREEVYRDWLRTRLMDSSASGISVERIKIAGFARERLTRRTHSETREAKRIERTDVRFEGELVVSAGDRFLKQIARGIGRHRAFGFGALFLVPPGTPYSQF